MAVSITEINDSIKAAMKSGDKLKVTTLRMLVSDVKNVAIAKRMPPEDLSADEITEVVSRQVKRRVEASTEFEKAGRSDLAEKEQAEAEILKVYLPEQLSDDEVRSVVAQAVIDVGATGPSDMGKVMGAVMPRLKGKADGKLINQTVKEELARI